MYEVASNILTRRRVTVDPSTYTVDPSTIKVTIYPYP